MIYATYCIYIMVYLLLLSHSFYRPVSIPDDSRREAVYFQQADGVALVEGTAFEFVIERKGFALDHFAEMVKIIFLIEQGCQFRVVGGGDDDVVAGIQVGQDSFGSGNPFGCVRAFEYLVEQEEVSYSFLTSADHIFDRIDLFHVETFPFRQVVGEHQSGMYVQGGGQEESTGECRMQRLCGQDIDADDADKGRFAGHVRTVQQNRFILYVDGVGYAIFYQGMIHAFAD